MKISPSTSYERKHDRNLRDDNFTIASRRRDVFFTELVCRDGGEKDEPLFREFLALLHSQSALRTADDRKDAAKQPLALERHCCMLVFVSSSY